MKRRILAAILMANLLMASPPALAGDPPPFPEFTFKRVGVPTAGAPRRIMVQIEPKEILPQTAALATAPDADTSATAFAWYWNAVSPALADAVPGRLRSAVLELAKGPGVPAPRLQSLQKIAEIHGTEILKATIGTKVSPALVLAVIGIESSGRFDAVSPVGALGLMQLMPGTAARFGVSDSTDPVQNIRGGVAYLDWLMGEFNNDPILVLASYNAGENAVRKHAGVPPYNETRAYVPKVLAAWTVARGLCQTPPELISDGCVFAVKKLLKDG